MLSHEIKLSKILIWCQPASLIIKYSKHYISFISGLAPALGQPVPCRRADGPILTHTDLLVQTASFPKEAKLNLKTKQNNIAQIQYFSEELVVNQVPECFNRLTGILSTYDSSPENQLHGGTIVTEQHHAPTPLSGKHNPWDS